MKRLSLIATGALTMLTVATVRRANAKTRELEGQFMKWLAGANTQTFEEASAVDAYNRCYRSATIVTIDDFRNNIAVADRRVLVDEYALFHAKYNEGKLNETQLGSLVHGIRGHIRESLKAARAANAARIRPEAEPATQATADESSSDQS